MRVGVDIGGTLTDAVHVDGVGPATVAKARTTPGEIARGLLDALRVLGGDRAGTERIALVTTEGFREQTNLAFAARGRDGAGPGALGAIRRLGAGGGGFGARET